MPDEDQGYYIAAVILPDGASLQRTDEVVSEVHQDHQVATPYNLDAIAFTGFDFLGGGYRNNAATIFVTQKHWDERPVPVQALVGELFMKTGHIKEALVLAFNPPPIFGLGNAGGFELYIQNRGEGGAKRLAEVSQQFMGAASQSKQLAGVQTLWRASTPQLYVDVDRERAKALGVPVDEVFNTLAATLGSYYVNDFNKYGRTWQVLMSAEAGFRKSPDDIGRMWVRAERRRDGAGVGAGHGEVRVRPRDARPLQQPAGGEDVRPGRAGRQLGPGDRRGRAHRARGAAAGLQLRLGRRVVPGEALRRAPRAWRWLLGALMVFLILSAQYEKWSLPLSVLLALPFGTFGALAAVWLRGMTNDVYFQIGLVTLLGLAAKNAILIVEYASLKHHEGMSASAAALEAARLRFRPIIMTSLAFILGVLPLAFSTRRRRRRAALGGHRRDGRHAGRHVPGDLLRADVLQDHHRRASCARRAARAEIQAEAEHVHAAQAKPGSLQHPHRARRRPARCPT